jgi:hypothetical protein
MLASPMLSEASKAAFGAGVEVNVVGVLPWAAPKGRRPMFCGHGIGQGDDSSLFIYPAAFFPEIFNAIVKPVRKTAH